MHFIFAKLYHEYEKNDPTTATTRITTYITIFYLLLSLFILLPASSYIEKNITGKQSDYSKLKYIVFYLAFLFTIMRIVYRYYIKNNYIQKLAEKHKNRKFNKALLYFFVVTIIPSLLVLAGIFTVLINGGTIGGNEIKGLLESK
ncbi:hypothetical protein [Flavobacterium soli]|uniref:hypothetical protein n=1 Tax=Flavobacterium soli TaxID=344881 RepID=UPI00047EB566|nr:hypothetical protein [Flavobacterium soli]